MTMLDTIIAQLGDVGQRMVALKAAEGAAGNVSVWVRELGELPAALVARRTIDLPVPAPALVGGWLVVSGSGCRLGDIARTATETVCVLYMDAAEQATLYTASDLRPTSELNSHLLIHAAHLARYHNAAVHAVLHAQPPFMTFLSHVLPPDTRELSRRLVRWQPETIMNFPHGVAVLPFEVPGSQAQAQATMQAMQRHQAVVWARHGLIVRDIDVRHAADLVEYAEAAAHYEYLNQQAGEPSGGLSERELRAMCQALGIQQSVV